ncbi:MAG TPA: Ig-like domain-containing protein, partial [Mycobacterium sp.]
MKAKPADSRAIWSRFKVGASAAAIALALGTTSFSANAVLERVGPISTAASGGAYPSWYQDTTGLALDFCTPTNESERDGGWCVVLTGDVPVVPEVFPLNSPTSFFDEHFYFMGSAVIGTRQAGGKALLVLAEEGAFAADVAPGQQITFARIRMRLQPIPVSGTYRFIHPYGEELLEGVAGDRIFFSDDVGVAAGDYTGSLLSRMGPWLLPSATPGGAEMPAVTATNRTPDTNPAHFGGVFAPTPYPLTGAAYIADPARIGPVTGSSLPNFIDSKGISRNHNIFRIEGPPGSGLGVDPVTGAPVDWLETTDFALAGRVFTGAIPGRVDVNRAGYTRKAAGQMLNVFASASRTTQGRIPAAPRPIPVWPLLSFFDAPCASAVDANGAAVPPFSAPPSAETNMASTDGIYWAQTAPLTIPSAVCVKDGNARDAAGNVVPTYGPRIVEDEVTVDQASYDPSARTLTVRARSSDEIAPPALKLAYGTFLGDLANGQIVVPNVIAPPDKARVLSSKLGVKDGQVLVGIDAPNSLPLAVADTANTPQGLPVTIDVLANDTDPDGNPLSVIGVSAVAPVTAGTVTNNVSNVTFIPNLLFHGVATFAYTISDGRGGSATAPVSITVNPGQNLPPVAKADSASTASGTPVTIAVLANDTDPNGDPLSVVAVTNGTKGTVVNAGSSVTYTPNAGQSGTDLVTYTVADGRGGIATGTVTVTIVAAPTLTVTLKDFTAVGSTWRVSGTNSTIG